MPNTVSTRIYVILTAAFVAAACAAFALVGTASANNSAQNASQVAYVTDYQSRDWCDDANDPNCHGDADGNGDDHSPTGPTGQTAPTGPTGPTAPPVVYWPAPPHGAVAKLRANGRTAKAPASAPPPVKAMVKAANSLTRKPYKWGGGHGRWHDRGYDCSGSVSYVLHAAGLLQGSLVSGDLGKWGIKGRGRWIQIYANSGHVFMVVAGLRFDTSGAGESGPRWRTEPRFTNGFKLRHPAGL
jgi:cell wall-associated NlpC family hydrolase